MRESLKDKRVRTGIIIRIDEIVSKGAWQIALDFDISIEVVILNAILRIHPSVLVERRTHEFLALFDGYIAKDADLSMHEFAAQLQT